MGLSFSSMFKRKKGKKVKAPAKLALEPAAPISRVMTAAALPVDTGPRLPRFLASASDQLDRRKSGRFVALRMRLRNAFTPSQPIVDGKMFAGRTDLLANMISSIEDRRLHLVLYGERGIGKTSLLHVLAEAAHSARYIVIYSSCGSASNFQDTFRAAATEIPLLFHSNFGPTTEEAEAGSSMADLLPDNFSPRQFADLCAKLTGTRVLVFLDEFDRAESTGFRRDVAELIKFLSDRSVRMQLVIGGVASDLAELIDHIPSIRRNILAVRVPQMSDEEVREMIATGERASGLRFDAAASDLVVRISRGWPYIAVLVCHNAGLCALDAEREVILEDDVSAALDASASELRSRMSNAMIQQVDSLFGEDSGRALMVIAGAALATGGEFTATDIERVSPKSTEATAAKRIADQLAGERILLERRGEPGQNLYGFVDDGLPSYLWFLGTQQSLLSTQLKARANAK